MATTKTIPLCEVFGPTLQGEGALAGKPTYFIRVGGCDYACTWCDTDIAVLPEMVRELPREEQAEILRQVYALPAGPEWVTISGGNPALYDLGPLVKELKSIRNPLTYKVAVETQGSRYQKWLEDVDLLTVSPKPPSSGLAAEKSVANLEVFLQKSKRAKKSAVLGGPEWVYGPYFPEDILVLKVVVFDETDYQFARDIHSLFPHWPFYLSVGTAMGGLKGDFVPPKIDMPGVFDKFSQVRRSVAEHGAMSYKDGTVTQTWTRRAVTDDVGSLLARWQWLADRMKGDEVMADVALFPQTHALIWGIHTRGV